MYSSDRSEHGKAIYGIELPCLFTWKVHTEITRSISKYINQHMKHNIIHTYFFLSHTHTPPHHHTPPPPHSTKHMCQFNVYMCVVSLSCAMNTTHISPCNFLPILNGPIFQHLHRDPEALAGLSPSLGCLASFWDSNQDRRGFV